MSHSQYGQAGTKDKVWEKAATIRGRDPHDYRRAPSGEVMSYAQYGKSARGGWEVDHINPKSRGGSDGIRNLQAMDTKTNRSKGNSLVKPSRHSARNK